MTTALILAGHGSHISPHTAGIVWEYVDILRARGVVDEVTACFWKETPHFNQVLGTIRADHVIIVPLFTAQGYFSQTVVPAEMGLTAQVTQRGQQTITLTESIGTHPAIADVVTRRITDTLDTHHLNPAEVAVAVIGHGTSRNRDSRNTTQQQAELLRQNNLVVEVLDAYLDDEPFIPSIYERTHQPTIIAVPFFLAIGSHVLIDVPKALGINPSQDSTQVGAKRVFYTSPVGTADVICDLVLDLAYEAGLPVVETPSTSAWQGFPAYGQAEFSRYLAAEQSLKIGQLRVTAHCVEPLGNCQTSETLYHPSKLRQFVREMPFRPLATTQDLPIGWHVNLPQPEDTYAVIETIYPSVLADWTRWHQGNFVTESLVDVSQRQVGMFKDVQSLPQSTIEDTVATLCGNCIRQPTWFEAPQSRKTSSEFIPCASPCNLWLSQAVKGVSA